MLKIGEVFRKKSLEVQLLISHTLLIALMAIVMVGAVLAFLHLGLSVDRILTANYKSVRAAQDMKDALERMGSASTFVLAGHPDRARNQYAENLVRFQEAYAIGANNVTEVGEGELVKTLTARSAVYRNCAEKLIYASPPMPAPQARKYYFTVLEPAFTQLKGSIQAILDLNQAAILKADARAKGEARGAAARAVIITLGALLLAAYMTFKAVRTAVGPLMLLTRQAEEIGAGNLDQRIEIERSDEVGTLATSFNRMTENLKVARSRLEHQLHLAQRMSDDALQSLYDPVIVTDANGTVVHVNRAAEGLFGAAQGLVNHAVDEAINNRQIVQSITNALGQEYRPPSDAD
ncbi:MAG TPA: HAMP domain-containing protein, partial [Armatimonadota bacterium]